MFHKSKMNNLLILPTDLLLPAVLIAAALLGRQDAALDLFLALILARLCALSTTTALRSAFATQPSVRYVQGSLLLALLLQLPGCAAALPLLRALRPTASLLPLLACGLFLNIEHVFYEYLFALNERESAFLCRGITALLTLTGLLLGPSSGPDAVWLPITTGISSLVGLTIGLSLGGAPRPKMNAEVLKRAPIAMLETALYPALFAAIARLSGIAVASPLPFFVGLGLYELCRTPFRRSPLESAPMNRALIVVCAVSICVALPFALGWLSAKNPPLQMVPAVCGALVLAACCAFAMYGSPSVTFPRKNPQRSCR